MSGTGTGTQLFADDSTDVSEEPLPGSSNTANTNNDKSRARSDKGASVPLASRDSRETGRGQDDMLGDYATGIQALENLRDAITAHNTSKSSRDVEQLRSMITSTQTCPVEHIEAAFMKGYPQDLEDAIRTNLGIHDALCEWLFALASSMYPLCRQFVLVFAPTILLECHRHLVRNSSSPQSGDGTASSSGYDVVALHVCNLWAVDAANSLRQTNQFAPTANDYDVKASAQELSQLVGIGDPRQPPPQVVSNVCAATISTVTYQLLKAYHRCLHRLSPASKLGVARLANTLLEGFVIDSDRTHVVVLTIDAWLQVTTCVAGCLLGPEQRILSEEIKDACLAALQRLLDRANLNASPRLILLIEAVLSRFEATVLATQREQQVSQAGDDGLGQVEGINSSRGAVTGS